MIDRKLFTVLLPFCLALAAVSCRPGSDMLFDSPAAIWEETLPLGNGRMGAMPDGGIAQESIVLNEETMWSGCVQQVYNPAALEYLPTIRQKLLDGDNAGAQKLMYRHFTCSGGGSSSPEYGAYQTLGRMTLLSDIDSTKVSGYRRSLDFRSGIARTEFNTPETGKVTREYFVSIPDDVTVVRIRSEKPVEVAVELSRPQRATVRHEGSRIIMSGDLDSGREGTDGVSYLAEAVVKRSGRETLILLCSATNFGTFWSDGSLSPVDLRAKADSVLEKAAKLSYRQLRKRQSQAFSRYYDRVKLDLGEDRAALYAQYGRYLAIASTARGMLPPNLQGIWAEGCETPWNGDYHLNVNLEMNCWPLDAGNLSDLYGPVTDYMEHIAVSGAKTARDFYNAPGWCAHVLANPWLFSAPSEDPSWGATNTGGAWMALQLWEHYLFTGDENYRRRIDFLMKGAAQYLESQLIRESHGWKVTAPSSSPENLFLTPDGQQCAVCMGPAMDTQICLELFEATGRETSSLAPMQISDEGYLMEWLEDYPEVDIHHRHVSHLYGLYPGSSLTRSPELVEAAKETLNRRGDWGTGWSRAWKVCLWARLKDGNRAYRLFESLMESTYPNMFCAHPPFQIDGNFGGAAGVFEMLLQSHEQRDGLRVISLLPACPDKWAEGSFSGLKARGNIEVSCSWKDRKLRYSITSPVAQRVIVAFPDGSEKTISLKAGTTYRKTQILE